MFHSTSHITATAVTHMWTEFL